MRVLALLLIPRVKRGHHARFGADVLLVGQQLAQRVGGGAEQDTRKHTLVVTPHRDQVVRAGEDGVIVRAGQQPLSPVGQPAFALQGRALGTTPMVARVIGDAVEVSVGAGQHVAAQGGGAAVDDSPGGLALVVRQRMRPLEFVKMLPEDLLQRDGHAAVPPNIRTWVQKIN